MLTHALLSQNSKNNISLVLHKVVQESNKTEWEDISISSLKWILNEADSKWRNTNLNNQITANSGFLTFDDGNNSDYEIVFPLLLERNMKAVFFVVIDKIGKKGFLSWDQIKEMQKYGMIFGSHSYSHKSITSLSDDMALNEFKNSKNVLEDNLSCEIDSFSYPFGNCSKKSHRIGFSTGYKYLYTSKHGTANKNLKVIPRNNIHSGMSKKNISNIMCPSKKLLFRWKFEDITKEVFKNTLGTANYTRIRNKIFYD